MHIFEVNAKDIRELLNIDEKVWLDFLKDIEKVFRSSISLEEFCQNCKDFPKKFLAADLAWLMTCPLSTFIIKLHYDVFNILSAYAFVNMDEFQDSITDKFLYEIFLKLPRPILVAFLFYAYDAEGFFLKFIDEVRRNAEDQRNNGSD